MSHLILKASSTQRMKRNIHSPPLWLQATKLNQANILFARGISKFCLFCVMYFTRFEFWNVESSFQPLSDSSYCIQWHEEPAVTWAAGITYNVSTGCFFCFVFFRIYILHKDPFFWFNNTHPTGMQSHALMIKWNGRISWLLRFTSTSLSSTLKESRMRLWVIDIIPPWNGRWHHGMSSSSMVSLFSYLSDHLCYMSFDLSSYPENAIELLALCDW